MTRFSILLIAVTLFLSACASSTPLRVLEVNALSSSEKNTGEFKGMEFLANPKLDELKSRINVVYIHGIGWTEDPEHEQLANDFLAGVAKSYGLKIEDTIINSKCGTAPTTQTDKSQHIYIKQDATRDYETILPGSYLRTENLVCMDKHVLEVDPALEFVVYRIFWDEIFWNALQFAHIGQDDNQGSSQNIANLRRRYNRSLKDELVNYGFSDAVMYLGPAGEDIRNGVRGALCAAAHDASGRAFSGFGDSISYSDICRDRVDVAGFNQFAFVSESLGSKIMFDVLSETLHDGRDNTLDDMVRGSELYMLANQVALLSLNNIAVSKGAEAKSPLSAADRPKIIAMSELNDFLTYELVPFFEQIWVYSSDKYNDTPRRKDDLLTPSIRSDIVERIGFDIVDMRLEFANPIVPVFKGLVDPMQAHKGHAAQPELMLYMLCGAVKGRLNLEGCLAQEQQDN